MLFHYSVRAARRYILIAALLKTLRMECILNTSKHFGEQLRRHRKAAKISQVALAKVMGGTSDNICHFEKGDNTYGNGSIQTVFKYAKALGYKSVTFKL